MVTDFKHKKIRSDKTFGEKMRQVRKNLGYSLEYAEKETKVSQKYLLSLENGNYDNLPSEVYVIGFLRRYSEFLNLNYQDIINQYRIEKKLFQNLSLINKKNLKNDDLIKPNLSEKWLKPQSFIITPKLIVSSVVVLLAVGILSYIWFQVKGFANAPALELKELNSDQIVKVESIKISGQTSTGANLEINNQSVAVDQNGNFVQEVNLQNGINNIEIIAKNKADKETKKIIKVLAEY